jgi:hypothetical protein
MEIEIIFRRFISSYMKSIGSRGGKYQLIWINLLKISTVRLGYTRRLFSIGHADEKHTVKNPGFAFR